MGGRVEFSVPSILSMGWLGMGWRFRLCGVSSGWTGLQSAGAVYDNVDSKDLGQCIVQ